MSKNAIQVREKELEKLENFTEIVQKEIGEITSALGWTIESICGDTTNFLTCPYDSSHRVGEKSFNDHLTACQWKAEGYKVYDIPFSERTLSPSASSCIKFDEQLQREVLQKAKERDPTMKTECYACYTWHGLNKCVFLTLIIGLGERLVPRTSDRLLTDFTSDERRALYEYVIANTVKPEIGLDIADINKLKSKEKEDKETSFLELLIQERNSKRRRAKHRGVHTNKKSHIEILREVINQQMELYTEYLAEQCEGSQTQNCDKKLKTEKEFSEHDSSRYKNLSELYTRENTSHSPKNDEIRERPIENVCYQKTYRGQEKFAQESRHRPNDYEHFEHRNRSRSRDRKHHKKHKRKEDKHKRKKYKSRERDESWDRDRSKYDHRHREKDRNKDR